MIIQTSKSFKVDIVWEVHKKTRQEVSAKLESYIYRVHMVCATNNYTCPYVHAIFSYPPHFLLKATILYTCALMISSRSFYYVLDLWRHIMWHVMWLWCHLPYHHPKEKEKKKKIYIKSEKIKENKIKIVNIQSFPS